MIIKEFAVKESKPSSFSKLKTRGIHNLDLELVPNSNPERYQYKLKKNYKYRFFYKDSQSKIKFSDIFTYVNQDQKDIEQIRFLQDLRSELKDNSIDRKKIETQEFRENTPRLDQNNQIQPNLVPTASQRIAQHQARIEGNVTTAPNVIASLGLAPTDPKLPYYTKFIKHLDKKFTPFILVDNLYNYKQAGFATGKQNASNPFYELTNDFTEIAGPVGLIRQTINGSATKLVSDFFVVQNKNDFITNATIHFHPSQGHRLVDSYIEYRGKVLRVSSKAASSQKAEGPELSGGAGASLGGIFSSLEEINVNPAAKAAFEKLMKDANYRQALERIRILGKIFYDNEQQEINGAINHFELLNQIQPNSISSDDFQILRDIWEVSTRTAGGSPSEVYFHKNKQLFGAHMGSRPHVEWYKQSNNNEEPKQFSDNMKKLLRTYGSNPGDTFSEPSSSKSERFTPGESSVNEERGWWGRLKKALTWHVSTLLNQDQYFNKLCCWILNHSNFVQIDVSSQISSNIENGAKNKKCVITNVVATWPSTVVDNVKLLPLFNGPGFRYKLYLNDATIDFKQAINKTSDEDERFDVFGWKNEDQIQKLKPDEEDTIRSVQSWLQILTDAELKEQLKALSFSGKRTKNIDNDDDADDDDDDADDNNDTNNRQIASKSAGILKKFFASLNKHGYISYKNIRDTQYEYDAISDNLAANIIQGKFSSRASKLHHMIVQLMDSSWFYDNQSEQAKLLKNIALKLYLASNLQRTAATILAKKIPGDRSELKNDPKYNDIKNELITLDSFLEPYITDLESGLTTYDSANQDSENDDIASDGDDKTANDSVTEYIYNALEQSPDTGYSMADLMELVKENNDHRKKISYTRIKKSLEKIITNYENQLFIDINTNGLKIFSDEKPDYDSWYPVDIQIIQDLANDYQRANVELSQPNKLSYVFNLTNGRTRTVDTVSKAFTLVIDIIENMNSNDLRIIKNTIDTDYLTVQEAVYIKNDEDNKSMFNRLFQTAIEIRTDNLDYESELVKELISQMNNIAEIYGVTSNVKAYTNRIKKDIKYINILSKLGVEQTSNNVSEVKRIFYETTNKKEAIKEYSKKINEIFSDSRFRNLVTNEKIDLAFDGDTIGNNLITNTIVLCKIITQFILFYNSSDDQVRKNNYSKLILTLEKAGIQDPDMYRSLRVKAYGDDSNKQTDNKTKKKTNKDALQFLLSNAENGVSILQLETILDKPVKQQLLTINNQEDKFLQMKLADDGKTWLLKLSDSPDLQSFEWEPFDQTKVFATSKNDDDKNTTQNNSNPFRITTITTKQKTKNPVALLYRTLISKQRLISSSVLKELLKNNNYNPAYLLRYLNTINNYQQKTGKKVVQSIDDDNKIFYGLVDVGEKQSKALTWNVSTLLNYSDFVNSEKFSKLINALQHGISEKDFPNNQNTAILFNYLRSLGYNIRYQLDKNKQYWFKIFDQYHAPKDWYHELPQNFNQLSESFHKKDSAAGCVIMAQDTGRICLAKRAHDEENSPGVWSIFGGGRKPGEISLETALREAQEESDFDIKTIVNFKKLDDNGKYITYLFIIPSEFQPVLNHEHDAADWYHLEDLPKNLHPELAKTLNKSYGVLIRRRKRYKDDKKAKIINISNNNRDYTK